MRLGQGGISFEFGQLLGINASCVASGYIGKTEFVIHGDADGKVHRQEVGSDFDGENIFSVFQTPYYYFGDPELRKIFYKVSNPACLKDRHLSFSNAAVLNPVILVVSIGPTVKVKDLGLPPIGGQGYSYVLPQHQFPVNPNLDFAMNENVPLKHRLVWPIVVGT